MSRRRIIYTNANSWCLIVAVVGIVHKNTRMQFTRLCILAHKKYAKMEAIEKENYLKEMRAYNQAIKKREAEVRPRTFPFTQRADVWYGIRLGWVQNV